MELYPICNSGAKQVLTLTSCFVHRQWTQTQGIHGLLDERVICVPFLCVYVAIFKPKFLPGESILCSYRQLRDCQNVSNFNSWDGEFINHFILLWFSPLYFKRKTSGWLILHLNIDFTKGVTKHPNVAMWIASEQLTLKRILEKLLFNKEIYKMKLYENQYEKVQTKGSRCLCLSKSFKDVHLVRVKQTDNLPCSACVPPNNEKHLACTCKTCISVRKAQK